VVTATLWAQVEALSLRDRIDLKARLDATIPEPPVQPGIPSTWGDLRDALDRSRDHNREHPETLMTVAQAMTKLRSRRAG